MSSQHHKIKTGKKNKNASSKVWGKEQDKKLRELFNEPASRGGIDPKDTTKATLQKYLDNHFPGRSYHSFRQIFRRKSLKYLLGEELAGQRKAEAEKASNCK